MEEKTYKARVEIGMIVEMEVQAINEDHAAAIAETKAWRSIEDIVDDIRRIHDYRGSSMGVRVIEVEEK